MQTSPATSYLEPIMTASDLASFAHAPLLRCHIMVLVQEEHKKNVSGYSATRKTLVDVAKVLPLGRCWMLQLPLACVLLSCSCMLSGLYFLAMLKCMHCSYHTS